MLEEKVKTKLAQNNQTHEIASDIPRNPPSTSFFAEVVVSRHNNSNVSKKTLHTYIETPKVNKCGATKSTEILTVKSLCSTSSLATSEPPNDKAENIESGWTTENSNRQLKEVRVGTNTELKAIQVTDRKKIYTCLTASGYHSGSHSRSREECMWLRCSNQS